jgi:hypothetical protein
MRSRLHSEKPAHALPNLGHRLSRHGAEHRAKAPLGHRSRLLALDEARHREPALGRLDLDVRPHALRLAGDGQDGHEVGRATVEGAGRRPACSCPCVGSKSTHQTWPRLGAVIRSPACRRGSHPTPAARPAPLPTRCPAADPNLGRWNVSGGAWDVVGARGSRRCRRYGSALATMDMRMATMAEAWTSSRYSPEVSTLITGLGFCQSSVPRRKVHASAIV